MCLKCHWKFEHTNLPHDNFKKLASMVSFIKQNLNIEHLIATNKVLFENFTVQASNFKIIKTAFKYFNDVFSFPQLNSLVTYATVSDASQY